MSTQFPSDRLAKIKRDLLRSKLIDTYQLYRDSPGRHEGALWMTVLEFAKVKLKHLDFEFGESSYNTLDDHAQEVVIKVWQSLPSFKGDAESFYSWVHKIAFNEANDFFNEVKRKQNQFVGLTVTSETEDGAEEETDNPALYGEDHSTAGFIIPSQVTGVDRNICQLLKVKVDRTPTKNNRSRYCGLTWEEIGERLGMTSQAVKMRVDRMKKRYGRITDKAGEAA